MASADYDTDILLWSEKQALCIRTMAGRVRGLPNEFDVANVAEEIESVGRSELRAAQSLLQNLFEHLIKSAAHADASPLQRGWFEELLRFRRQFIQALSPSMMQRLDVDAIWRSAVLDARATMDKFGERLPALPPSSPFLLQDMRDEQFDLAAAIDTLRLELASPEPSTD